MTPILYFLVSNLLASVSMGVILVIVPWTLVSQIGGQMLIYVSVAALGLLVLLRQRIYLMLSSVPSQNVMAVNMVIAAGVLSLLLFLQDSEAVLVFVMFASQIYIYFYYVARAVLTKQIVAGASYAKYNGILEVENQASTFIAGGVAAYLISLEQIMFAHVFAMSMVGLLVAAGLLFTKVRPVPTVEVPGPSAIEPRKIRLGLVMIALGASATFICVKLLDVINPIYVVEVLKESPKVIAISGICYTVGAIGAGVLGASQRVKAYEVQTILVALLGFLTFCALFALLSNIELFYLSWAAWGLFNSLSRISWHTLAMNRLDVQASANFFSSITMLVDFSRIALLLIYSAGIAYFSAEVSFVYLTAICVIGVYLVLLGRAWIRQEKVATV
ncbi:MAG: MFS transporter [Rhodovibrio sp.]|nr:MFS transporter [Rhodovibrio sp.]